MKMKNRQIVSGVGALFILLGGVIASGQTNAPSVSPSVPLVPRSSFKTEKIPIAPILPFSPRGQSAVPKGQMTFLVVNMGDVTPDIPVSTNDTKTSINDETGATYTPIGFGFAMKGSEDKFVMIGQLTSGDIKIVGPKKTTVGLIYAVPKKSKVFSMTVADKKTTLTLASDFQSPEDSRLSNLMSSGRIDQKVEGDHWEVK
jgi:hypothetical protein